MYLHLGADCMVKNSEIIAIFNIRSPQTSILNDYVKSNLDKYKLVDVTVGNVYASCILTEDTVYLSSISSITLKKRACDGFLADAVYNNY